ncbi:MAG: type IX secretion system membrane protein PorP/SprF [Bacteroidota bacterium]
MVKKLTFIWVAAILILMGKPGHTQDPIFSQFYANPLYLNPALAGSNICPRVNLNYRNQWPAIAGTYKTFSASCDMYMDRISGGVGLIFMNDQAGEGALQTTTASGIYSYRLTINRNLFLNAGFEATYFQRKIDWQKLTFPDMIDPRFGFVYNTQEKQPAKLTKGFADFSAGMVLSNSRSFYLGFGVNHLTQPNEGFYSDVSSKLNMKLTVHGGYVIDLMKRSSHNRAMEDPTLSVNVLFQQQQHFQQINYGLYFNRYPFVGGLWFRQNFHNADAIIFLAGFQQSWFNFGYSYDLTTSKLTNITGGAHEISMAFMFPCPPKKKHLRTINCPTF